MTQIAIIGNTDWQNKRKVQQTLQELKKRFKEDLIVVINASTAFKASFLSNPVSTAMSVTMSAFVILFCVGGHCLYLGNI